MQADAGGDRAVAVILLAVWVLALLEVALGVLRSQPATADSVLAVPFALGVPFLLRDHAAELWRRLRWRESRGASVGS